MLEETRPDGSGRARGVVSDRESGRRIDVRTFEPSPALADVVAYHWVTRWDLDAERPHQAEVLGDPCVHLAFEATPSHPSRVVGVCTRLWRRELRERGLIRATKLRAGAARAFIALPVWRLSDRVVPLGEVFGAAVDDGLNAAVLGPEDDRAGFVALERWLEAQRLTPPDATVGLAVDLVRHIAANPELTTAADVARASGFALRPLQRLFRDYVGASPKWIIRRHRLQEAALRLERGDLASLADLAAELGYSDHAHLSRDFKAATGRSPSDFRDDARPARARRG